MAGLGNTGINGFLSSAKLTGQKIIKRGKEIPEMVEHFLSGFAGYGWKIWEHRKGKYKLEIDDLNVRGTMTVYELLIQKIRAVIGALAITQGQGKIKSVALSPDQSEYLIQVEEDMSFREYDFIRCQTWTGNVKMYHVKIDRISDNTIIHVPIEEFDTDYDEFDQLVIHNAPAIGDDIVQFGNEVYEERQSAIYLHADESGQPAIDIMFGINSKDWTNCVKGRLGGDIPGGGGAKGMYFENGMIKGTDETGHTVYCIYPNGNAMFGDGSAMFNSDRSGQLAGGAIQWHFNDDKGHFELILGEDVIMSWDNLDNTTKEMLTPKIGENGNWWIGGKDTGQKAEGEDGNSPYIGENGNWWLGTTDTGVKAKANDGKSPYIGTNGNWWIWDYNQDKFIDSGDPSHGDDGRSPEIRDGYWWVYENGEWIPTGVKARGVDGKDSKSDEFIFIRNNNSNFGIANNTPTSIQQDDYVPTGWTDDPTGATYSKKYEWVSTRKFRDGSWSEFSTPSIWNIYVTDGEDGKDSKSDEFIFIVNNDSAFNQAINRPYSNPHTDDYVPTHWTDDPVGVDSDNKYEWVCKRIFRNGSWSEFSIPALWAKFSEDGKSPYIGDNGNWWIWDYNQDKFIDSGDPSHGDNGNSPRINDSGYWEVWGDKGNGVMGWIPTGVKARGVDGKDSKSDEFIFIRNNNSNFGIANNTPTSIQQDDYVPTGWTDDPTGATYSKKYEWVSTRKFRDGSWSEFSTPSIWNIYVTDGEDGKDSKSDEFIFIVNNDSAFNQAINRPYSNPHTDDYVPTHWTDDPVGVDSDNKYEWVCKRIFRNGSWSEFSIPALWAKWSEDANLLDWINEWNNNKTLIGAEQVVSPKMFSGTRDANGKLTGVALGRDCITIDGLKRTGIFALNEDELMVELDPINKKYKFTGEIEATSGDIGMFIIQGSDLVGINNEGTPIIKFTTDKIDDLPTTQLIEKLVFIGFQDYVLFEKDTLGSGVASYMDEFQEKINIPSVDSPVKLYDLDIIPPTDIRWHNTDFENPDYGSITTIKEGELKITDVRVLDEEGKDVPCEYIYEGEEIVGITFRSRNAGYYTIAGEILSQIIVPSQGYAEDVALCEATFRKLNYEIGKASNTVLASDGILSYYRSDDYFKFKSGDGFETVSGNYGLKVSPNGLYRLKNGEWELL